MRLDHLIKMCKSLKKTKAIASSPNLWRVLALKAINGFRPMTWRDVEQELFHVYIIP